MDKICFVIQRYGIDVNGGAEVLCRNLAEQLLPFYDVHVFTTKAKDYITWKNEYHDSFEVINGVKVHRFKNVEKRDQKFLAEMNVDFERYVVGNAEQEKRWVIAQGPYCPELIQELKKEKDTFKKFIFFTYLYYPTIFGLPEVKEKAILVPTAHDEPFIHMSLLKQIFCECHSLFYMTDVEKQLVNNLFDNSDIPSVTGGSGIEVPEFTNPEHAREKYDLTKPYLIYVGRIDNGKNVPLLINYFEEYKKRNQSELKLVLIGNKFVDIPENSEIRYLGFVDEQDKYDLIAGSKALVLPSYFESLSLVVLEAMKLKVPVIVSSYCEVVKQHCIISNCGLYYSDYFEFEGILNWMNQNADICKEMGENGFSYVNNNYSWDVIRKKVKLLIESDSNS